MKNRKAFTMIELMVAFFLLSVLAVPLYYFLLDTTKKANVAVARDYVKQDANKILALLENDLTQAVKPTEEERDENIRSVTMPDANTISMKVRTGQNKTEELKYTFNKPTLHRYFGNKCWLVSSQVDSFDVSPSLDEAPGKYVASLEMKSNMVGLKDDEQPTYEQQKIIVCMEEATEKNDPFWREVGDVNKFFATKGSIMAGLKEDAKQMIEDFSKTWADALGDIKNMTIGQLKEAATSLKADLKSLRDNITSIDKDISDLDWEALYKPGFLGIGNGRKKKKAKRVKEAVVNMKSLDEMDWNKVKKIGTGSMKETAIKEMFNAKEKMFQSRKDMVKQLNDMQAQAGEGVDIGLTKEDLIFEDK